ncbi:hypothetical protein, partial [Pseudomonas guariconensis]|uniref:hypothetical protein n=1 Tax=Pseudomonas guariconensis TaxID=1288410 RepID=UPI001E61D191
MTYSDQSPNAFQDLDVSADLKSCASCLLRDSAARQGWADFYQTKGNPLFFLKEKTGARGQWRRSVHSSI